MLPSIADFDLFNSAYNVSPLISYDKALRLSLLWRAELLPEANGSSPNTLPAAAVP